jgi:UDP-N-acetylmuramate--alanine ligase
MSDHYHLIGIGGIGMSGLARILLGRKASVSGSDIAMGYTIEGLMQMGATIFKGHSETNVAPHMTVIYSSDIKLDNPEYQAAQKMQCALLHRSDLLAHLLEGYKGLAVAGTHGKTTTSALLASVLVEANFDPSFAVGGMLAQWHSNARFGEGEWFVFEADESDRTFLRYSPFGAIVTNIDNDHLIAYEGSEKVLIQAFKQFISQVSSPEHLFWCGDDAHLYALQPPGQSYGFEKHCHWKITRFQQRGFNISFDLETKEGIYKDIEVALTGRHNALNAAAVFALALSLGIAESSIRQTFRSFKGVMRRCEKKGEAESVLFLDDYAHHPTEIQATLKAIRQAVAPRRLLAVFQPHRYSRTQDCLGQYGSIFDEADELVITDIFGAGETPIPGLSHQQISNEISQCSTIPFQYTQRHQLAQAVSQLVRPHDVVVTLGAGDITKLAGEIMPILKEHPPVKLKVGLIFGGCSTEHEISLSSAQHFCDALNRHLYDMDYFGITKQGRWITGADAKRRLEALLENPEEEKEWAFFPADAMQQLMECDVLIPVLHGPFGEDGTIQGFFEMLQKAYVGCDHRSAAICMDKALTKKLALLQGVRTPPFVEFSIRQWQAEEEAILQKIEAKLNYPLFVKPVHLGSSIGVAKVNQPSDLRKAIQNAFLYDTLLLVENGIQGRELEFAVLGNDEAHVYPPGEVLTRGKVYDYEAKYGKEGMKTAACASIPSHLVEEGKRLALQAYQAAGCCGMARVDFFLDERNVYWLNEINPIPGFTAISLYPQICNYHGLSSSHLMDQLILLALERRRKISRLKLSR